MAQKIIDVVVDFALEHYVARTSISKTGGKEKKTRVIRSELSKEAAHTLLQYLTAHGMTDDEAVSYITTRFNRVLASQTTSSIVMRKKTDNSLLFTLCGVALLLGGAAGILIPNNGDTFFYVCILLMGLIVLWTGLDPLPRAMTKFWKEKCQDFDGMTLDDLTALHDLVEKTARKGTLVK